MILILLLLLSLSWGITYDKVLPLNAHLTVNDSLCDGEDCLYVEHTAEWCHVRTRGRWNATFMYVTGVKAKDCYMKIQCSSRGTIISVEKLIWKSKLGCSSSYTIKLEEGGWRSVGGLVLKDGGSGELVLTKDHKIRF